MSGPCITPEQIELGKTKFQVAPLHRVICHDDPHTTCEFVVEVLRAVFRLPQGRAEELMWRVHHSGAAVIGCYPKTLAEKRATRAMGLARTRGFPLSFSVELDD